MNMWILFLKILTMPPDCDSVTKGRFRSTAAIAKWCLASTPWTWAMCNQSSWLKIILLVATGPYFTCIDCYSRRSATVCFCLLVWICADVCRLQSCKKQADNKRRSLQSYAAHCAVNDSFYPKQAPKKVPCRSMVSQHLNGFADLPGCQARPT